MDLKEAVGIIGNVRNTNAKWDASFCEGAEWALKILRSVTGAWVDANRFAMLPIHCVAWRGGSVSTKEEPQGLCALREIKVDEAGVVIEMNACICTSRIADDPRCPAVILKEG